MFACWGERRRLLKPCLAETELAVSRHFYSARLACASKSLVHREAPGNQGEHDERRNPI